MPTPVPHPKETTEAAPAGGFETLEELALDLRWSWSHATDEIWRELDAGLWEFTHNPWVVLQAASRERVNRLLAEGEFRGRVENLARRRRESMQAPTWFQRHMAGRR